MARPVNPYVAGAPLRSREGFFGRRDVLAWVERELRNPTTNALVLTGPRRIGKTSILLQLQRALPADAFLPVYFDLQDQAARPLAQVLADLADVVAERVGLEAPSPDAFDDQGRFFRDVFLPQVYAALGPRRLVVLLDEFDVLDREETAPLPETAAVRALFPFLRRMIAEDPRTAFLFAVGRRPEDLSLDFLATFKTSLVREVWVLDRESAEELVRQAERNGTLRFTDRAVVRILGLTNCHPYFTQLLCQRIWERAYRDNPRVPPSIDGEAVEAAVPDALRTGEQAILWLWNGLSPEEKIYAAGLAALSSEGEEVPEERVIHLLASHATRLHTREVEEAPRRLVRRRVLEEVGERRHRFTIDLFRRWVRANRPVREVKDELDRVEPRAEQLYRQGRRAFEQRRWEAAVRYFRRALAVHPAHFRARLYLGEALLELGRVEVALAELERAYELDPDEAKFALARAKARAVRAAPTLLVDHRRRRVYLGDREIRLSPLEFSILALLAQRAGRPVPKEEILQTLRAQGRSNPSIDAAVYRLRKKLGDSARNPTYLETRRGEGYVLHNATYVP
ncbi:MAG TPA: tetratricopeptide repeat protein [Chloroflexi bacterium]|nr:tetratricopeptide repeat protein [Chloroflexota bacterium]